MGDTKIEILAAVKVLLGLDGEDKDELLMILIDDAVNAVLSYCHIEVLPRPLVSFIPTIVTAKYRNNENGAVKSITEGERRVEYADDEYDFLSAYTERLKPFVSRKVKVPSEVEAAQ